MRVFLLTMIGIVLVFILLYATKDVEYQAPKPTYVTEGEEQYRNEVNQMTTFCANIGKQIRISEADPSQLTCE